MKKNTLLTRAIKAAFLEFLVKESVDFDSVLWTKAFAKYKRMCNQYSDFVNWTEEHTMENTVIDIYNFYLETKDNVQNTANRERALNSRYYY
jgi:hypothetical protein